MKYFDLKRGEVILINTPKGLARVVASKKGPDVARVAIQAPREISVDREERTIHRHGFKPSQESP